MIKNLNIKQNSKMSYFQTLQNLQLTIVDEQSLVRCNKFYLTFQQKPEIKMCRDVSLAKVLKCLDTQVLIAAKLITVEKKMKNEILNDQFDISKKSSRSPKFKLVAMKFIRPGKLKIRV